MREKIKKFNELLKELTETTNLIVELLKKAIQITGLLAIILKAILSLF